jgi:thiol-disulfide isomerase/thioredoxin
MLLNVLRSLLLLALAVPVAQASDRFEAFSSERLDSLQKSGETVLVDVFATWCPTCKRQGAILDELMAEPEFADLAGLKLDWDVDRRIARELGAPRQSTLILFRGGKRIGMSVAETDPQRLRAFLATSAD